MLHVTLSVWEQLANAFVPQGICQTAHCQARGDQVGSSLKRASL